MVVCKAVLERWDICLDNFWDFITFNFDKHMLCEICRRLRHVKWILTIFLLNFFQSRTYNLLQIFLQWICEWSSDDAVPFGDRTCARGWVIPISNQTKRLFSVSATLLNCLLLFLIAKFSSKELGLYKYLLSTIALCDILMSIAHGITAPVLLCIFPSKKSNYLEGISYRSHVCRHSSLAVCRAEPSKCTLQSSITHSSRH